MVPVEHILTTCLQVQMKCDSEVTALLYDGYRCLFEFRDELIARALEVYYSMIPSFLPQNTQLHGVYGSAAVRILDGARKDWSPCLTIISKG